MPHDRLVLGIDPGSRCMGYGLVRERSGVLTLVEAGTVRPDGESMSARLGLMYSRVVQLLQTHSPQAVAVENVLRAIRIRLSSSGRPAGRSWPPAGCTGWRSSATSPPWSRSPWSARGGPRSPRSRSWSASSWECGRTGPRTPATPWPWPSATTTIAVSSRRRPLVKPVFLGYRSGP